MRDVSFSVRIAAVLLGMIGPALVPPAVGAADEGAGWLSAKGHFRVSFASRLEPIVINRMHAWLVTVEDVSGRPVEGAQIEVSGGMPAHDHGLPTSPQMTRELGDGEYLVEGMRFHMSGAWSLEITVHASGISDLVVISLDL